MTSQEKKIKIPGTNFSSAEYKFGRVLWTGLLAGLIMLGVGIALTPLFLALNPFLQKEYENRLIFRAYTDPAMSLYFAEPFLVGVILAWVWNKTRHLFSSTISIRDGVNFALIYWITTLPGMLMSYSSFQLSAGMVLSWSAGILIQGLFASIFFSRILR